MSQLINFIKLDFNRSNNITIPTIEWDQGSRFVRVQLQNNNQNVDITGSQVIITVIRNDLEEVIELCNILDAKEGLIEFEISKSMVARQGDMLCQLKLSDNDSVLSSQLFKISVNNTLMVSLEESRSEMDALIHALGEVQNIDNRFAQTNAQLSNIELCKTGWKNAVSYGVKNDNTDTTEELKRFFKESENCTVYFENGIYNFNEPIELPKSIEVVCDANAVFSFNKDTKLPVGAGSGSLPMFYRKAKLDSNNYVIQENGVIKWRGGVINGNASYHLDNTSENYWDSADKNGDTAWSHDYQRAFLLCGFTRVELTNLKIKDIFGHAIGHYGNALFAVENVNIEQGIDNITHPHGHSRRDGISGGSNIIDIRNCTIFSDDDSVAIVNHLDWGFGKSRVDSVNINNITLQENNKHFPIYALSVYGGDNENHVVKNIYVENIAGTVTTGVYNLRKSKILSMITNNVDITVKGNDSTNNALFQIGSNIDLFSLKNVKITSQLSTSYNFVCVGLRGVSDKNLVKHISFDNVTYDMQNTLAYTDAVYCSNFIYLFSNSLVYVVRGDIKINRKNSFNQPYDIYNAMEGNDDNTKINTTIELESFSNNIGNKVNQTNKSSRLVVKSSSVAVDEKLNLLNSTSYNKNYLTNGYVINRTKSSVNIQIHVTKDDGFVKGELFQVALVDASYNIPSKIFGDAKFDKDSSNGGSNGWGCSVNGLCYLDTNKIIYARVDSDNVKHCFISLTIPI